MSKKQRESTKRTTSVPASEGRELDAFFKQQLREHAVPVLFFTCEKDGTFIAYTQREDAEKRQYHLNRVHNLSRNILVVSK